MLVISTGWAQVIATRITVDNAPQTVQQGPDAIGGIDDWFISNGTVCAVVSDIEHEGEFSSKGGILIDLGFCDRADDHLTSIQDFWDGKRNYPMNVSNIEIEQNDKSASIVTYAEQSGSIVTTRYTLSEEQPTQLSISKQLRLFDESADEFHVYSAGWFNYHSLETFIFSSKAGVKSRGFDNVDFITRGVSAIKETASNADTVVLLSPPDAEQPIAYGWHLKSAMRVKSDESYPVPAFLLSDEESTAILLITDDFYLGDGSSIGWLQLAQLPFLSLAEEDYLQIEEAIYVGNKADVASITDQLFTDAKTIIAQLSEVNSALNIQDTEGSPVNFVRPDSSGKVEFKLLPGSYLIEHRGSANRVVQYPLTVDGADIDLGDLVLPKPGQLILPRNQAMRLVVVGINGTTDPDFQDRLTNYSVSSDEGVFRTPLIRQIFLAGIESDPQSVHLAAGTYRVYATRGPEYSLSVTEITVEMGEQTRLNIEIPKQVVETPGYIAADLHVHAGVGFDNTFSTNMRVKTFVAEHGEVMVSSEHDVPVDFAPTIDEMGVNENITSIAAVEMTSLLTSEKNPYSGGHVNFFPVTPKPNEYRKGMINHENRRLREILADFRYEHPLAIAQLNHARENSVLSGELPDDYEEEIYSGAFLEHMGSAGHPYNPEKSLLTEPNNHLLEPDPETGIRDIDFEAMEIINPGGPFHQDRIDALRKDWLSFIQQGFHITGTANSDSHHAGQQVAVPRTMVSVKGDTIATFNLTEFLASIKQGNVYGTTGPMLDISLSSDSQVVNMGQLFNGKKATLNVSIRSASWIPVEKIKVQINSVTVIEDEVSNQADLSFDLEFTKDSFVTVEVSGPATEEYQILYPEITPYAFTNPIYVDFDADGEWQAPGL